VSDDGVTINISIVSDIGLLVECVRLGSSEVTLSNEPNKIVTFPQPLFHDD
jgi:hypothetical protein